MPNPSLQDIHISQPLTNYSYASHNSPELVDYWMHDKIFPIRGCDHERDEYYKYLREYLGYWETEVAPSTLPPMIEWNVTTESFKTLLHKLEAEVMWDKEKNQDAPLNLKQDAVDWLLQIMHRDKEMQAMIASVGAAPVWANGVTLNPAQQWNAAASTPIADVATARNAILQACGELPNNMLIGWPVWRYLKVNTNILANLQWAGTVVPAQPHVVSIKEAAALFEVDNFYVSKAVYAPGALNQIGTSTPQYIWGKNALIWYANPNAGLKSITAGFTFVWQDQEGGTAPYFREIQDERLERTIIQPKWWWNHEVICSGAGYYIKSAVA